MAGIHQWLHYGNVYHCTQIINFVHKYFWCRCICVAKILNQLPYQYYFLYNVDLLNCCSNLKINQVNRLINCIGKYVVSYYMMMVAWPAIFCFFLIFIMNIKSCNASNKNIYITYPEMGIKEKHFRETWCLNFSKRNKLKWTWKHQFFGFVFCFCFSLKCCTYCQYWSHDCNGPNQVPMRMTQQSKIWSKI